jgi:hypothetical protein
MAAPSPGNVTPLAQPAQDAPAAPIIRADFPAALFPWRRKNDAQAAGISHCSSQTRHAGTRVRLSRPEPSLVLAAVAADIPLVGATFFIREAFRS